MAVHDQVFHIWHRFKNDLIDADQLFDELKVPREELEAILQRGQHLQKSSGHLRSPLDFLIP